MWEKEEFFKDIYFIHLIHDLLSNYHNNKFDCSHQEEDDFFELIIEFILGLKGKLIDAVPEHANKQGGFGRSQSMENFDFSEGFICNLFESISYFLEDSIGDKTFNGFLKFFQISTHLSSPKIFEKLFMLIFSKYGLLKSEHKLKFFDFLRTTYQKSELVLQKLSKSKAVLRDVYEHYQKEEGNQKADSEMTGIDQLLYELMCYKLSRSEIIEDELLFFTSSFSFNFFFVKMKTIYNVLDKIIREHKEGHFIRQNTTKHFLYLCKDFSTKISLVLTQFDYFLFIMDKFYNFFLEQEILFSVLVPIINPDKFKDIDLIKGTSDASVIPKIEGIFFPFIALLFKVLEKLFLSYNEENKDVTEIRMQTILGFMKKILFGVQKNDILDKKKKLMSKSFMEIDDFAKVFSVQSRNFKSLPENHIAHLKFGVHYKDDFNIIFDYIFYELLRILMISIKVFDKKNPKELKDSKEITELLSCIQEINKNPDTLINFINGTDGRIGKLKIEKYQTKFSNFKNDEINSKMTKEMLLVKMQKKIKKLMKDSNKDLKDDFEENQQNFAMAKEFFKKFLGNLTVSDMFNHILDSKNIIVETILPFFHFRNLFSLRTVWIIFFFLNM